MVCLTPLASTSTLALQSGMALFDLTEFKMVVGSLQYLFLTRHNIASTVNKLSQFMHRPTTKHWNAMKYILCFICEIP